MYATSPRRHGAYAAMCRSLIIHGILKPVVCRNSFCSRETTKAFIIFLSSASRRFHPDNSLCCSCVNPKAFSSSKNWLIVMPSALHRHSSVEIDGSVSRLNILRTVDHGISASLAIRYIVHPRSSISSRSRSFTSMDLPSSYLFCPVFYIV